MNDSTTDALTDAEFAALEPWKALAELDRISVDEAEIKRLRALYAITRGVSVDETRPGKARKFDIARLDGANARLGFRKQTYTRAAEEPRADGALEAFGVNGSMILEGDSLTVSRRGTGLLTAISQGLQGDKSISLRSVTAVQFLAPNGLTRGYLRLSINGRDPVGGITEAVRDENAVMFDSRQLDSFQALRDAIRSAIVTPPAAAGRESLSVADEIEKLASLMQRGLLTEEEFTTKKRQLLGL